jgi:hypothetical protein
MSHQTEKLREWIRSGKVSPDVDKDAWELAVARVYEEERREESPESQSTEANYGI